MASCVYLFKGNSLVFPAAMNEKDALFGVEKQSADAVFGELEYTSAPLGVAEPLPGALLSGELPEGWKAFPVREVLTASVRDGTSSFELGQSRGGRNPSGRNHAAASMLRIYHILQWKEDSRFCGSCGAPNGDAPDELARLCPRCGRVEYPRISPAVITLVTNSGGEALLAHNKKFKNQVYSLIAGFTEAGESLEESAAREIREEVNIEVSDIHFVTSQSWPFPNSLMVGFTASYAGGELKPDGEEITSAGWFSRESVRAGTPEIPAHGSVSRYIIEKWLGQ